MDGIDEEFLIESQEGLDRMERCLTELEERPDDAGLIVTSSAPCTPSRYDRFLASSAGEAGSCRRKSARHAARRQAARDGPLPPVAGTDGRPALHSKDYRGAGFRRRCHDNVLIGRLEELQAPRWLRQSMHARGWLRLRSIRKGKNSGAAIETPAGPPSSSIVPSARKLRQQSKMRLSAERRHPAKKQLPRSPDPSPRLSPASRAHSRWLRCRRARCASM